MTKISHKVLLSLFVAQLAIACPVQSAPNVYVASWRLKYSMSECVDDAYTIARRHQFTEEQELTNDNEGKLKALYATHKTGELSIVIMCSRDDGTATYSVSGYDNDQTYNMYSSINNSFKQL